MGLDSVLGQWELGRTEMRVSVPDSDFECLDVWVTYAYHLAILHGGRCEYCGSGVLLVVSIFQVLSYSPVFFEVYTRYHFHWY